jgi:hypothetical protein
LVVDRICKHPQPKAGLNIKRGSTSLSIWHPLS